MELLRSLETSDEEAKRRINARYHQTQMDKQGWKKPRYSSPAYQVWLEKGWISWEEADADKRRAELRAARTGQQKIAGTWAGLQSSFALARMPLRWANESPVPSDQYAPDMATTAARDNRLTPQAKALLQVLHARCGRAGETETTKGTLASIMQRSERSIQRYIADLARFGYILTNTRRNARGLYIGLVIKTTELVQPFWASIERCGKWLAETFHLMEMPFQADSPAGSGGFSDKTRMSLKNQPNLYIRKGHAYGVT